MAMISTDHTVTFRVIEGMVVISGAGQRLGRVGKVIYDPETGQPRHFIVVSRFRRRGQLSVRFDDVQEVRGQTVILRFTFPTGSVAIAQDDESLTGV